MEFDMGMAWLVLFVLLLIGEITSVALTSIWFAVGAIAAFVVSLFCEVLWVQILVFLLVSMVLLICMRPWANRFLNKNREKTNIDAIVGRLGVVTQNISNLDATGEVSLAGQIWMARTASDNMGIAAGAKVIVKEVRGVKLIVEEAHEH